MAGPTVTITATVQAVSNAQAPFTMFGLDSNWVLVIITLLYTLVTFLLVLETWLSRRRLERRYEREKKDARQALVVPVDWSTLDSKVTLDIANLGPGPAKSIRIAAVGFLRDGSLHYYAVRLAGLPVGQTQTVQLEVLSEGDSGFAELGLQSLKIPTDDWRKMTVQIQASTISDEEMPVKEYSVGYFG